METNQPPHLVALAHPTRRIAEAGEDEAERAGGARGGGGAVDQEVRKTETRGGGGGGGIAKDEGESRGRRGRCAKRRRETRERGGGKSRYATGKKERKKREKVARGVKATETAEEDDLCDGAYAAREDRGCGPLRQKRFPRVHEFLGTGNRGSPLLSLTGSSSHGAPRHRNQPTLIDVRSRIPR